MPGSGHRRRATIHDVARAAGVSAATASKVLRGVTTVKEASAKRVHEAVRALGYRKDPIASGLRNERRRIIGAIAPDLESPFFGSLVTELERAAEEAGYAVILASSRECEEREAELVSRLNDWRVAGTVLAPVRSEKGLGAERLRSLDMQAVLLDRVSADPRFDTIAADNQLASASVADFLIGAGHTHLLLSGGPRISKAVRTRIDGFRERATALNPKVQIDIVLSEDMEERQRRGIQAYFDQCRFRSRPTAVFALSQSATLFVLSELRRRGLRLPDDISLIGFDDADWMRSTWPAITAVAQPVTEIARRAVATLLGRVEGALEGFPVQILEPCVMAVRQSAIPNSKLAQEYSGQKYSSDDSEYNIRLIGGKNA